LKIEIESNDIEAIALKVAEIIKPIVSRNGKSEESDIILTPETLAEYLKVEITWVYKQVSTKAIPYFKSGKYVRFKKSAIDKWIKTRSVDPGVLLKVYKNVEAS